MSITWKVLSDGSREATDGGRKVYAAALPLLHGRGSWGYGHVTNGKRVQVGSAGILIEAKIQAEKLLEETQ